MIGLRGMRQELRHLINLTVQVKGEQDSFPLFYRICESSGLRTLYQ